MLRMTSRSRRFTRFSAGMSSPTTSRDRARATRAMDRRGKRSHSIVEKMVTSMESKGKRSVSFDREVSFTREDGY